MSEQKSPAFQFYFKDWRSSSRVSRMSFKERGMYLELLIEQWDKGPLPLEPRVLAECIGAKDTDFAKCWPTLKACFLHTPDGWVNERLERERVKQQLRGRRAVDWGKDGSDKRWGKPSEKNGHPIGTLSQPDSFALAIAGAIASAGSSAGAVSPPPTARSKRPIFTGQRLTVFEWMLDELVKLLGPHTNAFDLHEWFFALDGRCVQDGIIPPPRDNGAWLKQECLLEAQRRGLPLKVGTVVASEEDELAALIRKGPSVRG